MDSPYKQILGKITSELERAVKECGYECEIPQTLSMSKAFGDISSTCALKIAKQKSLNAVDVAQRISAKIPNKEYIEGVTTENGFVNFRLERHAVAALVVSRITAERDAYVGSSIGNGKRAIVEYISANPIHPLHLGQLRNALIGDVVSNIYVACGYKVERENYIDDLGRQAAMAVWGSLHNDMLGIGPQGDEKYDHYLGKIYVAVNRYLEEHKDASADIDNTLVLIDQSGTYEAKFLREMVEQYLMAEYQTAFSFGMYQDVLVWESDVVRNKLLEKAMTLMEQKGIAKKAGEGKYAGCMIIDFKDIKDLPQEFANLTEDSKVLIRSNGTPNYLAKDIGFHMWKFGLLEDTFKYKEFIKEQPNGRPIYTTAEDGTAMNFGNADITINVIDARQIYEQALVKLSLDAMGYSEKAEGFRHLAYGVVELEGSVALAGRKGTWIGNTADDLIREAREKAKTLIGSRFALGEDEKERISSEVAVAAIRFEFMKLSHEKKLVFSWSRALNFEGDSGPYCQYMHARATRILENAGSREMHGEAYLKAEVSDVEFSLLKMLMQAQEITEKACTEVKPNVIIDYISDLASAFSKFYEQKPVLKAGTEEEKSARLSLTGSFRQVMAGMLKLCGITPIERM